MKFYSLIALCFICTIVNAQDDEFSFPTFQHLTTKDGLSNNSAFVIMQDSHGFIWIATNYGLNRYDGYTFKVYNYDMSDTNSISPGWYRSLLEDKNGIIWAASTTQGIFSFDPCVEKFTRYYHQPGYKNSLAGDIGDANMVFDSSGILWISTSNGLNSYDPVKNKFELFTHKDNDSSTISANKIIWICTDSENNLWTITGANMIDVFSISKKKVIARFAIGSQQMPGNKNEPSLYAVYKGENNNIWISSEFNGLYCYNTRTKNWKHFINVPGNDYSLKDKGVFAINEDRDGNLLVAPINSGITYYQASSGKFFHSDEIKGSVNCILKDKSGKVWLACGEDGIYSSNPIHKKVETVNTFSNNSIKSDCIVGFYRSHHNQLFINAYNGVYNYNRITKNIKPFEIIDNGQNLFDKNWTWMIRQDAKGVFWFCTLNGLISYNAENNSHHFYRHDDKDVTSLSAPSATSITYDNNGKYWISTFGGGLNLFNPETGKFKSYKTQNGNNSISTNYVHGIFKDSKGLIYIGSWYGGLIQFNPASETFRNFRHTAGDTNSISCDITWPLYEDKNGIIWVGTVGGGLNAFDPTTGRFKAFTVKDGLPSNAVINLVIDDDGKAWLGTYRGLASCNLPAKPFDAGCKITFRNYDVSDGLPANDCYFFGAYKETDGSLFFSTSTAGFYYFHPHDWKDNDFIPPIYITGFSLMNKEVNEKDSASVLKVSIDFTKKIVLNYKQNILSFTFAALNFIHPEKNKYAYKLENYDRDWIYTDASKRYATYTNLDPGEYIFKVKGCNNDGVWNNTPAEIIIIITPPFWQTLWFRILIASAAAVTAYTFYRYRIGQILLLQRIRNKIASDLHDDIGSTLNSISVFSEVAKKDSLRRDYALNMIGESSRKIIESMSDIVWAINPENDSFDKIIFRMRSLTHNLLKAKKIDCVFRADESLYDLKLKMEIRRNLYLIFKEALNNLVKYSNATRAAVLVSHENKRVSIIIRDDGVGFDCNVERSGNGLNNMRKRASEIGAMLMIESAIGKGTSIELNLKL